MTKMLQRLGSRLIRPATSSEFVVRFCSEKYKPPGSELESQDEKIPLSEKPGQWSSAFSLFKPGRMFTADFVAFMQQSVDLRAGTVKKWWACKKSEMNVIDQRFIEKRLKILGCDLAAAHFIIHRDGAIRFVGQDEWTKKDAEGQYELPSTYQPGYAIEAIDASKTKLVYEGLINLRKLRELKWLSLSSCPHIDDWCLDRLSGEFQDTLEYLDISNCPKVTERGLEALHRTRKLKTLRIFNLTAAKNLELVCLMLEDLHPHLVIEGVDYMNPSILQNSEGTREGATAKAMPEKSIEQT